MKSEYSGTIKRKESVKGGRESSQKIKGLQPMRIHTLARRENITSTHPGRNNKRVTTSILAGNITLHAQREQQDINRFLINYLKRLLITSLAL